ncbi:hypothetical protein NC652_019088 [Populus alba x Populus x berolinensis]|uniref:Uncharacterized protein n=1 Tax=Populus alba x Populus x berolinensis TaxID=444605 RepID=A0AAD6QHK3_9ROSI|nr:hypothetical protein NC652_019085 [Populus alba x Populus x berolinensis]KAJ6916570.1 hypothetical protein NC652_019088 [Populus alba x Populus x berolinensis]KAJ6990517.1 hypothetical protein NC653_018930 [Populus alba x Populus x berolinensis]KAJ6990519.1 hypothetical protein NC653_018932 [Populus alba x Populus x berolinensis]KAJ6990524.1 hypothetical protein NC653_018937 [Populus alba x Populus x berolinensis]
MLTVNNNDFQFYLNQMIYTRQNPDVIVFLMIAWRKPRTGSD